MSLFDQLTGTWQLVSYSVRAEDGSVSYPLGHDVHGYLMYTGDGHVSVNVMTSDRPEYASGDVHAGTLEEMATAAAGALAYAGTFSTDDSTNTIEHHVTVSLFPNWIGVTQQRQCHLDGDQLVLSSVPVLSGGVSAAPRIEWRRAVA